jgi:hypothetical protein
MTDQKDDGAWFAPKRFGLGAGLPIAWQGWAMLAAHAVLILLGIVLLRHTPAAKLVWVTFFVLLPVPLYAAKTRGGWKWRWGSD